MNQIVAPEIPDEDRPETPRPLAGDWKDDDGLAIDDYFEQGEIGPPVASESVAYERDEIKTPTRILSRRAMVGTNGGVLYDPAMLFPADVNRCGLLIVADGPITITSDKTDYNGAAQVNTFPWQMDSHTGAVWVHSGANHPVYVDCWVTTK